MSSMARVIFFVDWTERIRRRTTRSWAPMQLRRTPVSSAGLGRSGSSSSTEDIRSQPTSGFTSSGGVVAPSPAPDPGPGVGTNVCRERLDGVLQRRLGLIGQVARLADRPTGSPGAGSPGSR